MSIKQNVTSEEDVYIIRKLLEQIHNYFEYLECPYYNSNFSERDLLLLLIQPSERRYHLLEWMISRLEPDIDFYLPNDYGNGEFAIEPKINKDCINAIAYLKNLGLCYSRVMVPDIIHAKVGPLIQLKFLVRLLRGIRLKSWNRKPILKRNGNLNKDNSIDEINVKENRREMESKTDEYKLGIQSTNHNLMAFINNEIDKNRSVKLILEMLENHLDREQIINLKEKLYITLMKRLTVRQSCHSTQSDIVSHMSMDSNHLSFTDGIIQLIVEEILSPDHRMDDRSSLGSSNSYDSYCSTNARHADDSQSRSISGCSGDVTEKQQQQDQYIVVPAKQSPELEMEPDNINNDENITVVREISKSYSTSINLTKQLTGNGDDCPRPKPRLSDLKTFCNPETKI